MHTLLRVSALSIVVVGCSGPSPEPLETWAEEPRRVRAANEPAPDAGVVAPERAKAPESYEPITLTGKVMTHRGAPVAGRPFRTVGRDRDRRNGVTAEDGALSLEGVVPPYDLLVDGVDGPTIFLGVTRPDPFVELREESALPPLLTVTVGVLAQACGEPRCIVDVVTASATGNGYGLARSETNGGGEEVAIVEVTHGWNAARPDERIEVHALVHDAANRSFAYARADVVVAASQLDAGFLRAEAVAASEPLRVAVASGIQPADTRWTVAASVDIGAATFPLAAIEAPSLTTRIPLLPGASWRAIASAATLGRVALTWTGARDPRDGDAALDLPAPLANVAVADGRLRWSAGGGALATVDVIDVTRRRFRYRIVTNETDVALARLEALGREELASGAHELVITARPDVSLHESLDPDDVSARNRHTSTRTVGRAAYARVAIDLGP